jgi:hypothetical protein
VATPLIFAVLGPLFLALGAWRCVSAGGLVPQARAWLIIGFIFSAIAGYLWLSEHAGP